MNLEKASNELRDLQENYQLVVSKLKEKECTISKLLKSGILMTCWHISATFFGSLFNLIYWFILHVNRKYFDWACKGNVYWSAECVKWYWFVVLEVGYGYFTLSSFDNKFFVPDLRRFQKKSASWEVKMNLTISHQDFLFVKLDIFMRGTIKKKLEFGWIFPFQILLQYLNKKVMP